MQELVDHLLIEHIVGSVDPQYLEVRNKENTGFAGETTRTLITYIRQALCIVSTHHKNDQDGSHGAVETGFPHFNIRRTTGQTTIPVGKVQCTSERQREDTAIY